MIYIDRKCERMLCVAAIKWKRTQWWHTRRTNTWMERLCARRASMMYLCMRHREKNRTDDDWQRDKHETMAHAVCVVWKNANQMKRTQSESRNHQHRTTTLSVCACMRKKGAWKTLSRWTHKKFNTQQFFFVYFHYFLCRTKIFSPIFSIFRYLLGVISMMRLFDQILKHKLRTRNCFFVSWTLFYKNKYGATGMASHSQLRFVFVWLNVVRFLCDVRQRKCTTLTATPSGRQSHGAMFSFRSFGSFVFMSFI